MLLLTLLIGYQEIFGKVKAGGTTQTTSTVLIGHMSASTKGVISPDLQLTRVFYCNRRILPGHNWCKVQFLDEKKQV